MTHGSCSGRWNHFGRIIEEVSLEPVVLDLNVRATKRLELSLPTIGHAFLELLSTRPGQSALVMRRGEQISYCSWSDIAAWVNAVRQMGAAYRLAVGDHVGNCLPNSPAWIAIDLACQLEGWVHVAIDTRMSISATKRLIQFAETDLVFVPRGSASMGDRPAIELDPWSMAHETPIASFGTQQAEMQSAVDRDSLAAQMLFTSGTSGEQKGVLLSHRNLVANALAKLDAAPQYVDDLRLNILPFAHAYARTCELSAWILSGSQLAIAVDWQDFLEQAKLLRPTLVNLVPHLASRLQKTLHTASRDSELAAKRLLGDRMRLLQVGGAALSQESFAFFARIGLPPLQGYGLTEASPVICSNRVGEQRPGTVGPVVKGVEVKIDTSGTLWTRGPHVMMEYWRDEKSTREKLQDGWLNTGDLAERAEDGSIRILGRADDLIVLSTGYKATAFAIQELIADEDWVEQTLIVGKDRPHLAALVWPRWDRIPDEFKSGSLAGVPLNRDLFYRALQQRWQSRMEHLPRPLRIECIGLMPEAMSHENGCLNFKGGLRRKEAERFFAEEIERLYGETRE